MMIYCHVCFLETCFIFSTIFDLQTTTQLQRSSFRNNKILNSEFFSVYHISKVNYHSLGKEQPIGVKLFQTMKIDIHNHILPETWPDLKEVSFDFPLSVRQNIDENNDEVYVEFHWQICDYHSVMAMVGGFNQITHRVSKKARRI